MKILIAGGSGLVGSIIIPALIKNCHDVTILTMQAGSKLLPTGVQELEYTPYDSSRWQFDISQYEVIINLAGQSVFRRWNSKAKASISDSRILTTQNLVKAMMAQQNKRSTLINISGVGYYGFHGDEILTENEPGGQDFLAKLAAQWEETAMAAEKAGIRVIRCRLGQVFTQRGGELPYLLRLARLHLGCPWGDGKAWISWISQVDLARAFVFLINKPDLSGAFNLVTPGAVRNGEMMRIIAEHVNRKPWLSHIPASLIKLIGGEFSSVMLTGQRAVPYNLTQNGFCFELPQLSQAIGFKEDDH